jgi:hypothetical protein
MADAYELFAHASSSRQETLRAVWAELYDELAGLATPGPSRVVKCAVYVAHPIGSWRAATKRLTENGHPACIDCIAEACDITTGYPLTRVERKS